MTSTADLICLAPSTLSHPSILSVVFSYVPHNHDRQSIIHDRQSIIAIDQRIHTLKSTEPLAVSGSWSYYRTPLMIETIMTHDS